MKKVKKIITTRKKRKLSGMLKEYIKAKNSKSFRYQITKERRKSYFFIFKMISSNHKIFSR